MGYHPGWRGNCVISYQGFLLFASTTQETMDPFPFCYLQKQCQDSCVARSFNFRHLKFFVQNAADTKLNCILKYQINKLLNILLTDTVKLHLVAHLVLKHHLVLFMKWKFDVYLL